MVYASVNAYLDPPPNWSQQLLQQQQQGQQAGAGGVGNVGSVTGNNELLQQLAIVPVAPRQDGEGTGSAAAAAAGSSNRPVSMTERARLAKIPQPEAALKCPRCDSTNTKFCYFNNYSLSQPRHFCKTCRRYWTRGGALRNVPVGGGCRRNKRSKGKSSAAAAAAAGVSAGGAMQSIGGAIGSGGMQQSIVPQLSFLGSLHNLMDYGANSVGLSYGGLQSIEPVDNYHHVGGSGLDQWRLQQAQAQAAAAVHFPFMTGLEQAAAAAGPNPALGLYSYDGETDGGHIHGKPTAAGLISQLASVKMEENHMNLPRHYLGITPGNEHYWAAAASGGGNGNGNGCNVGGGSSTGGWHDLSGFSSSSTGNLL